ncbi:MAG: hypothetical protein H9791_10305, partial [Candidatus Bacteroides intestinipullorum]|nr:hypothetical protein [Candidatus Bacteroides intestinipullorum]
IGFQTAEGVPPAAISVQVRFILRFCPILIIISTKLPFFPFLSQIRPYLCPRIKEQTGITTKKLIR